MDVKRAAITGVILWIAVFFEVSILMFALHLTGSVYYTAHYILAGIIFAAAGVYYFKNNGQGISEGIRAGFVILAFGIALDVIITVPLFVKDYAFFLNPALILGYAELIAVIGSVGWAKEKEAKK